MPTGKCPLCLNHSELEKSHLLPAAVYRACRDDQSRHPDPIFLSADKMKQTSRQVADYMLCGGCEDLLNEMGETWVLSKIASESAFPFWDLLMQCEPFGEYEGVTAYSVSQISGLNRDALAHFGIGVFWKSSAHTWPTGSGPLRLTFNKYGEEMRRYLLGIGPFPTHCALSVSIVPRESPLIAATLPYEVQSVECHMYAFCIPGIHFVIHVGKRVAERKRLMCLISSVSRPIFVNSRATELQLGAMKEAASKAVPSRRLSERLKLRGNS